MTLTSGTRVGPYEIMGPLGAGGMGEVYRAHDTRLRRHVAVQVLPGDFVLDPDRLRRFEQEARAAGALNHPNLVTIFDVGTHEGSPYLVMELLEGSSLRAVINSKPLPMRKALDYATQAAQGLAAAHERGIVHRDLKPDNIFVTREGRVKILDFGLAKARLPLPETEGASSAPTATTATEPGAVLGTIGYMAPEQVAGRSADQRSDIFSFGAVLYEMLSGQRAFKGANAIETMNAILSAEPAEINGPDLSVPPSVDRIVRRCLEKDPARRFRTAHDLAFALEMPSAPGPAVAHDDSSRARAGRKGRAWLALGLAGLALALSFYVLGRKDAPRTDLAAHRLTFRRGCIDRARFAPDQQTILYGQGPTWAYDESELFTTRPESPESRALGLRGGLLSVSSTGELALVLPNNELAQATLGGGAPRPLRANALDADWMPDGKRLVVALVGGRVEFLAGRLLYQSKREVSEVRVSPSGDRIALIEVGGASHSDASIVIVDLEGRPIVTTRRWRRGYGIAWGPDGREVWFTASEGEADWVFAIRGVDLSGRVRQVASLPGGVSLKDVSRDGRVLLTRDIHEGAIAGIFPGPAQEIDASWLDDPQVADLSADGRTLLFTESGEGAASTHAVYLRKTDGSPAVRLAEGTAESLSPDAQWVAVGPLHPQGEEVVLVPTGVGVAKTLSLAPLAERTAATWFPDGERLLVSGAEPGHRRRCYEVEIATGAVRPLTPEGVSGAFEHAPVSPDGGRLLVRDERAPLAGPAAVAVYSIEGGRLQTLSALGNLEGPISWSPDGGALIGHRHDKAVTRLVRFDLVKNVSEDLGRLGLIDSVGVLLRPEPIVTPDQKHYAYSYHRILTDLYLVDGLR